MVDERARVALEQLRAADRRWQAAIEASAQAPPDAGFSARLLDIADAAEQEAGSFRHADMLGLAWRSDPDARGMELSYELRRGARSRPGPHQLWERFDACLEQLGEALAGVALSAITRAFAELSETARELAGELDGAGLQRRQVG